LVRRVSLAGEREVHRYVVCGLQHHLYVERA
jgi:hypothetical protein